MGDRYQQWWERLTPLEREHTTACVEADNVDEEMLTIFGQHGPVGAFGVRWAGGTGGFLPGPFVEFVKSRPACARLDGEDAPPGTPNPRRGCRLSERAGAGLST